jgi:PAS domain S-box-containing protein
MPTRRRGGAPAWLAGEDRLRLLLDGMADDAVAMLGPQGMLLTWSAGAARIFGHEAEEIIGQHFSMLYPDDARRRAQPQAQLDAAAASGRFEDEGWRIRKSGARFWTSVVITPLRDRSGRLRGFGQVTRDLSDRLRAEDLLAVLDAAADAILGVDEDGRVMFLNSAAGDLFGYAQNELAGRPIEVLIPVEHRVAHARHRVAFTADPGSGTGPRPMAPGTAVRGLRKDGTAFPAQVTLAAVGTPRGRVIAATVRPVSG